MSTRRAAVHLGGFLLVLLLSVFHAELVGAEEVTKRIDPKVEEVVRQLSDYYRGLKSLKVDIVVSLSVRAEGITQDSETTYRLAVEKPNKLSMRMGEGAVGGAIVSDGTKVYTHASAVNAYTVSDAPANLDPLSEQGALDDLFVGCLIEEEPYGSIMEGVKGAKYLGVEEIDGARCHHLSFVQEEFDWELWVEDRPQPLMRKVISDMSRALSEAGARGTEGTSAKATVTLSFKNWVTDRPLPADTFTFTPPEGARKVDSFAEVMPEEPEGEEVHPLLGKPAPDFRLELLGGGQVELSEFKGSRVVVLDFWATWCPPCRTGLPILAEVTDSLKGEGVVFYAVNEGEDAETIRGFLTQFGLKISVALDTLGTVAGSYRVTGIPQTVIIDKKGVVQTVHVGLAPDPKSRLKEELEAVLAGKDLAGEALARAKEAPTPRPPRAPRYVGKPIPAGPDAYCWRDYLNYKRRWLLRAAVEPYREVGLRNPSWDEAAIKLLEVSSHYFARLPDSPSREQLLEATEPLVASGCNDPLILYFIGAALHENGRPADAEPYLLRAVEGFKKVKYPRGRARFAPVRLAEICQIAGPSRNREFERWLELMYEWTGESAADDSFAEGEERMFWVSIEGELSPWHTQRAQRLYDAVVGRPGVDPWIENMVAGWCHLKLAWEARGDGWASTVTEEGWLGFGEHMEQAHEHLSKAYELHPEFPEAATHLISVVMAGGGEPGETERMWFDRAVAAHLDYMPPYSKLVWALRPRWGGSHGQMYEVGRACLATGRFDTAVPKFLLKVVQDIAIDEGRDDLWQMPRVYDDLCALCDGHIAEGSRAEEVPWWKSLRAAAAWRCGRYEDARAWFDQLGDEAQAEAFRQLDATLKEAREQTHAYTGPLAEAIKEAEQSYRTGKRAEALPLFEGLVTEAKDPRTVTYLRGYVVPLGIEQALSGNQWVDLLPGEDLAGWQTLRGYWAVEPDGALRATVEKGKGTMLLCNSRIHGNYEIRGVIEFQPGTHSVQAGVVLGYKDVDRPFWTGLRLYKPRNLVSLGVKYTSRQKEMQGPLMDRNNLHIQVWDSQVTVFNNGEPVFINRPIEEDDHPDVPGQVGLGAYYHSASLDPVVWYRDFRIRRLDARPPTPEMP